VHVLKLQIKWAWSLGGVCIGEYWILIGWNGWKRKGFGRTWPYRWEEVKSPLGRQDWPFTVSWLRKLGHDWLFNS